MKHQKIITTLVERDFIDHLGKHLGYLNKEDWYRVKKKDFIQYGGTPILDKYKSSPYLVLKSVYPTHDWQSFRFHVSPQFWDSKSNVRQFLDYLGRNLSFEKLDDWYGLTSKHVIQYGGQNLLHKLGNVESILQIGFPSHKWDFNRSKQQFEKETISTLITEMESKLFIQNKEEWYRVSQLQVNDMANNPVFSQEISNREDALD
eukprot:TRINITY_DN10365_c0_g1_i1.p1 TRINITY_DN10365_c0_g1~~TRINITY_DN10365_c0_g1_i1.p1  ORF type:complete len:204 (+),score=44.48 TRINITY_DN10365_c0_g1_i1:29-640(+)